MTSATYSRIELKPIGSTPGGSSSNGTSHQGARANAAPATARTGVKGHAFTVAVLLAFGLLPLVLYFSIVRNPFTPKPVVCGRRTFPYEEEDLASKTTGAQSIFTIDRVPTQSLPFWLAKLIDTAWDLFVARGMQFLASAISYVVLSNSLLRTVESSPIPYRTFAGISLNGASVGTVISLLKDLGRHSRQRTAFLFAYSALAITYVLAVPTLLSTMTGYISSSSAFVKVPDTDQFVPSESFVVGSYWDGLSGVANGTCVSNKVVGPIDDRANAQVTRCNSTCWINYNSGLEDEILAGQGYFDYMNTHRNHIDNCTFFSNESYTVRVGTYDSFGTLGDYAGNETHSCNETITIELDGKTFPYVSTVRYSAKPGIKIWMSGTLCYAGRAYDQSAVDANTKCLPDTDDASYRWGFSSTLTSVVLIVHALWAISVYAVWLDAVRHSSLLREGYSLTQLRAVFALAAAARELTGLDVAELVRPAEGKEEVEDRLDGDGAAAVEFALFARELLPRAEGEARETCASLRKKRRKSYVTKAQERYQNYGS